MDFITTKKAPQAIGPYSQGIVVGNMIYTSGQIPIQPDTLDMVENDIIKQTHQAILNLEQVLLAGGSSLDKVIKTTVFVKDIKDFTKINEIYATYFKNKPARSLVEVSNLPKNALIEIEAIAIKE